MNSNFKVVGFTPLEIKPECTVSEADTFTTGPSELTTVASTVAGLERGPNLPRRDIIASRRDIIASRRDFKVTRHETL